MRALRAATLMTIALVGCTPVPLDPDADAPGTAGTERRTIADVLAGNAAGFKRADAPREFAFPADHGMHPGFRSEWWYFTGHLTDSSARRYGFQVTFFRSALAPAAELSGTVSAWRTRQVWMGHLAVGDYAADRFYALERFARGGEVGLAGASPDSFSVWLDDWRAEATRLTDANSPVRLRAVQDGVGVALELTPQRAPWLQGDAGLSQKGPEPGQASYYYSVPRWSATGTLTMPAGPVEVTGSAWLDREWSSSALGAGQVGWDWFSINLDDGSDLMLYLMRREDGSADVGSSGVLRTAAGNTSAIALADIELRVLDSWVSPSGTRYPARWVLRLPTLDLELDIRPLISNQQLDLAFRYWEGGVECTGTRAGEAVTGHGFVELTGY